MCLSSLEDALAYFCHHCHATIKVETLPPEGSVCCGECGVSLQVSSLKRQRVDIGIHPALARRYESVVDAEGLLQVSQPLVRQEADMPLIPGYELIGRVGQGAMGNVYRAYHVKSGREAAVKVLSKELAVRKDLVARFEREAAALRSFRHPNIVAIFDSGFYQGYHYYCMEYCQGYTLRQLLRDGRFSPAKTLAYMRLVLRGLKAAHARGIIHRDLKPENIMVEAHIDLEGRQTERVLLVDFGLAGILYEAHDPHPNLTHSRVTMGTVNYMAPEQHLDAKRVDQRTDLYACGVILYECLMGDLPLGRFLLPSEKGMGLPKELDSVLMKALARNPAERYQSALELDDALAALETSLLSHVPADLSDEKEIALVKEAAKITAQPRAIQATVWSYLATQWNATILPRIRKPKLAFAVLSLALGLMIGFLFSHRLVSEVLSFEGKLIALDLSPTFHLASPLVLAEDKHKADLSLANPAEGNGKIAWSSNSAAWSIEANGYAYMSNEKGQQLWRSDLAFLTPNVSLPDVQEVSFSAKVSLPKAIQSSKAIAATRFDELQGILGSSLEKAQAGIFFLHAGNDAAIGIISYEEGGCALAYLSRKSGYMRVQKAERALCQPISKKPVLMQIRCDENVQACTGQMGDRLVGRIDMPNFTSEEWKIALACANMNCLFEPK